MATITIAELHQHTADWLKRAAELGELEVTDEGRIVARIVPAAAAEPGAVREEGVPYFANRPMSPEFRDLMNRPHRGRDSTEIISEERDER